MGELTKGCVVLMKKESGLVGYGNAQCVQSVCETLSEVSLFGHNQHYKTYHVAKILYRLLPEPPKEQQDNG